MCQNVLSKGVVTCIIILAKGESRFIRPRWLFDKRGIAIVSKESETVRGRSFASPICSIVVAGFPAKRIGYKALRNAP